VRNRHPLSAVFTFINHSNSMNITPSKTFRDARRAFTLLEILVVLAIIGMLVGLAVRGVTQALEGAKVSTAKIFVTSTMKVALTRYKIDMGDFPSTAEGLQALISIPTGDPNSGSWKGPYDAEDPTVPVDPWGHQYQYAYPSTHAAAGVSTYDLWSNGANPDGSQVIGNWMP
jgi:general secretion pathway protein G